MSSPAALLAAYGLFGRNGVIFDRERAQRSRYAVDFVGRNLQEALDSEWGGNSSSRDVDTDRVGMVRKHLATRMLRSTWLLGGEIDDRVDVMLLEGEAAQSRGGRCRPARSGNWVRSLTGSRLSILPA